MSSRSLQNFEDPSTGGMVNLPWRTSSDLASRHISPTILEVWGAPFDKVTKVIQIDLTKAADITRLRSSITSWEVIDYYTDVCGSLIEAISEAVVSHCYNLDPYSQNFTQWIQNDRRTLIKHIDPKYGGYDNFYANHMRDELSKTMRGRSIFLTRSGYIGIACEDTEPGDTIVVLRDSPVPFVLRDTVDPPLHNEGRFESTMTTELTVTTLSTNVRMGPYTLIGDAYVHALDLLSFERFKPKPLQIH